MKLKASQQQRSEKMERKSKILWITILILIFSLGYYLRAYIPLHKDLPYSPYEAFVNTPNATEFIQKQGTNPTTQFIGRFLTPVFGNLYLIYIFGAIIIFFLGKEITDKNLGGILAFPLYALSSENLLQYTRTINKIKRKSKYNHIHHLFYSGLNIISYRCNSIDYAYNRASDLFSLFIQTR
jgi:hypothetical protein